VLDTSGAKKLLLQGADAASAMETDPASPSATASNDGGGGLTYIPLSELADVPFRLKVLGADRVSVRSLPRLQNNSIFGSGVSATSDSVDLFVRVYLFHGMTPLNYGQSLASQSTSVRFDSSSPRFAVQNHHAWTCNPWILPPPLDLNAMHIPYARLPRNTRVMFLLYGSPAGSSSLAAGGGTGQAGSPGAAEQGKADHPTPAAPTASGNHHTGAAGGATPAGASATPGGRSLLSRNDSSLGLLRLDPHKPRNEVLLGFASIQLVDEQGEMVQGKHVLNVWTFHCGLHEKDYNYGPLSGSREVLDPIVRSTNKHSPMPLPTAAALERAEKELQKQASGHSTTAAPIAAVLFATLTVQFDSFALPVVAPLYPRTVPPACGAVARTLNLSVHPRQFDKAQRAQFGTILMADPLYELTRSDKELLWVSRAHLIFFPTALPKFLACVDWSQPGLVAEAHRLLAVWSPPVEAVSALGLLDAHFADPLVREYAVHVLDSRMGDAELQLYLLQLTQCLKFEAYHDSALWRFLLRRALASPLQVGHHLFWHLKAEMGSLDFQERFTLMLEEYLSFAGLAAIELRKQASAVHKLQKVAELIVELKVTKRLSDAEATKEYHAALAKLNRDFFRQLEGGKFQIPLNPKLEATVLRVEKCKFMSSKKVPLWLVFENADPLGPDIYVIFKSGDDLRQDILTLQLLRIMDKIWLDNGLDMRLKPYKAVATGVNDANEGVGMIEVVMGSDTTSGIQLKYGGGAIGALKLDPLDLFIRAHNPAPGAAYDRAVDNFLRSCAGYCVATFVLGIGDRHNGNIMVCTQSSLDRQQK
jgi:phosphatidylinositol-4,5-bisphosphate 3-kinase